MCPVCNGILLLAIAKVLWEKTGFAARIIPLVEKLQIKRLFRKAVPGA
jgi:hypothetical protein